MLLRLAILLGATPAIAAPPKPVKLIQTKEVDYGDKGWVVHGFRFIAATPTLSAQLNHLLMEDTRAAGWLEHAVRSPSSGDIHCEVFATSVYVSWHCGGIGLNEGGGGGYKFRTDADLVIDDNNQLSNLSLSTFLVPGTTLDKLSSIKGMNEKGDACTLGTEFREWRVTPGGLEVHDDSESQQRYCALTWKSLADKLAKDNPVMRAMAAGEHRVDEVSETPSESVAGWAKAPRFVPAGDDAVIDQSTGLTWATHDNGADLDYDAARVVARKKGDGWRLPTEAELEGIVDPEYAHKEKTDCTKGKSDLLITPAIHLSCGLVWTDSMVDGDRTVGVGFISGTPRLSKQKEKKNYRALLVKSPPAKPKKP